MKKIILACVLTLLLASFAAGYPVPKGIDGIVYDISGDVQVPSSVRFSVKNWANGYYVEGFVGRGRNTGKFSVVMQGNDDDLIEIRAWNLIHHTSRNITLFGVMHGVDLFLNMSMPNFPPNITSYPVTQATEDLAYEYQVQAADPNNDPLSFSLENAPQNMSIGRETGLISWTPGNSQVGNSSVIVIVSDGNASANQSFTIMVSGMNDPPIIVSEPNYAATEQLEYKYAVAAIDIDSPDLFYSLPEHPQGMTIEASTGLISWIPLQAGTYKVTIMVSDGSLSANQSFRIFVNKQENEPPEIISIPATTALEDELYTYQVHAIDQDNDTLSYSLLVYPEGMSIDNESGLVTWLPEEEDVGRHLVAVGAYDAPGGSDTQSFNLTVENTNDGPRIISKPLLKALVHKKYTYTVDAVDPDNDTLRFSLSKAPKKMRISKKKGKITWVPRFPGKYPVSIEVSDGELSDHQSFTLNVGILFTTSVMNGTTNVFTSFSTEKEKDLKTVRIHNNELITRVSLITNTSLEDVDIGIVSTAIRPAAVPFSPPVFVYRYFNILGENIEDQAITHIIIRLRVKADWLEKYAVGFKDIALVGLENNNWVKYRLTKVSSDDEYLYLESILNHFGHYVIGSLKIPSANEINPIVIDEKRSLKPPFIVMGNVLYKDKTPLREPLAFSLENLRTNEIIQGETTGPGKIKSFYSGLIHGREGDRIVLRVGDEVEAISLTGNVVRRDIIIAQTAFSRRTALEKMSSVFSYLLLLIIAAVILKIIKNA